MGLLFRRLPAFFGAAALLGNLASPAFAFDGGPGHADPGRTATPIRHLVVIYDENVSFDHYFATYPQAANLAGEPRFDAAPFTPRVNNLANANLLATNPNEDLPFRLDRTQAATTDQNHGYTAEQRAYDGGKADKFVQYTGTAGPSDADTYYTAGVVMGYYDGNTVTALWNYAQHYAMSDNSYGSTFGPSTPGALEAISGQTDGFQLVASPTSLLGSTYIDDGQGGYTDISDIDPAGDSCSSATTQAKMIGPNIGDLLNEHGISWGGFMGGFNLSLTNSNGTTGCGRTTLSTVTEHAEADYIPHHNWFQYYASTANPTHARPSSVQAIGHTYDRNGQLDPANHQYDIEDFFAAVQAGNFPAVAYLKAPGYQDGHAGYSDPLDEQAWIVQVVNFLQQRPEWKDTAVIIAWDDSDGWYDHAFVAPTNPSFDSVTLADQLDAPGVCGSGTPLPGLDIDGLPGKPVNGRCGPGPRLPFLVISPWAKPNYVSHTLITQSSILRFIEDNWLGGERLGGGSFDATAGSLLDLFDFDARVLNPPLFLDQQTGEPVDGPGGLPVIARGW